MGFGRKRWGGPDRREEPRLVGKMAAWADQPGRDPEQITLRDLNTRGFRANLPEHLLLRSIFRVRLPSERITHAQVVRIDEEGSACEFLTALNEEQLEAVSISWLTGANT